MQGMVREAWRRAVLGAVMIFLLCGCSLSRKDALPDGVEREDSPESSNVEAEGSVMGQEEKETPKGRDGWKAWEGWRERLPRLAGEVSRVLKQRERWLRQEQIRRILEEEIVLPARYDAREMGRTAPVEDQKDLGTCWAFSSLTALENTLLPQERWDFSEDHMSHNPNFILGQENGGEYTMSMAYLLSWRGPVTEEQDPYGDGVSPEGLAPVKHVQEIRILPENDREMIKRAVLACGGVQSSLYTTLQNSRSRSEHYNPEAMAYCYPYSTAPNHDVVIVGWDDNFPGDAFKADVEGDGAFLCENSWGTEFGDGGFFYVSYYDGNLGKTNIAYTCVEEPDNYGSLYQSDLCGWVGQLGYGEETAWAANVYMAREEEEVAAAGFYATGEGTEYQVYLLRGLPEDPRGALARQRLLLAEGVLKQAGYYTIPLRERVPVGKGERFAVMVCLRTPGAVHPIAVEYDAGDGKCQVDLSDGEGYISFEGMRWERVEEKQNCNICLKAYTCAR